MVFSAVALFATTFCLHLPNISTLVDSVESAYHVPRFATTLIVAAAFAAIVFGGVKRIGAWAGENGASNVPYLCGRVLDYHRPTHLPTARRHRPRLQVCVQSGSGLR